MKVCYLIQQFLPEIGAGPARASEFAMQWAKAGADVDIVTAMPNRPEGRIRSEYRGRLLHSETWAGGRVYRSWLYTSPKQRLLATLLNNISFMLTSMLWLVRRSITMDVLIASSPPFFVHITGVVVARLRRVPLVLEVRDLWPDYIIELRIARGILAAALLRLERFLLQRADCVVVISESFKRRVVAKGVDPEKVVVITNGVDTGNYYAERASAPLAAMAKANTTTIGYLGNFGISQGLETVVAAAAMLMRCAPDIQIVMAGGGSELEKVQDMINAQGITNIVLHGPIAKTETRAFYNSCAACIVPLADIPALSDALPSKMFEIMACEVPVIACLNGDAADLVERCGAGLASPAGDAVALAENIQRIASMQAHERRRMGVLGRSYVNAHAERSALARRYLGALRSAVEASALEREAPRARR